MIITSNDPDEGMVMVPLSGVGVDVTPPATPTGLAASAGDEQVTLTWSPNAEPDLSHYIIYRGTSPSPTDSIASTTRTSYPDVGLINGTTYYYRVRAVDKAGNKSGYSEEVGATPSAPKQDKTAPSAPIDLTANGFNPSPWQNMPSFNIDWTNPFDKSRIAGAWYKLGAGPESPTDGTYTTDKPFTVTDTTEGEQLLYVGYRTALEIRAIPTSLPLPCATILPLLPLPRSSCHPRTSPPMTSVLPLTGSM